MKKIALFCCDTFYIELKEIAKELDEIVDIFVYSGSCHHRKEPFDFSKKNLDNYEKVLILGGCALDNTVIPDNFTLIKKANCFEMFADKVMLDKLTKEQSYLLTPTWLNNWEKYLKELWRFDEESAKLFFGEFCKKLVLLDTGIANESKKDLEELSHFVDQPYEILDIGLDHFKGFVQSAIFELSFKKLKTCDEQLKSTLKSNANYIMAFDFLSGLNQTVDENEIINKIQEVFFILFAPMNTFYIPYENNKMITSNSKGSFDQEKINKFISMKEQYIIEDKGFLIKLFYSDELIGIVGCLDVQFPNFLEQYLNQAFYLSNICALAVVNTRNYKKTKQMEAELFQHEKLAAMGEMMVAIAHQWRQPLNELHINIEMLDELQEYGKLDQEHINTFVDKNTNILRHLSTTISDFSNFFRREKIQTTFNIKSSIESILNIIGFSLEKNGIDIKIEGEDLNIYSMENDLKQVLLNLITNAKDAILESKNEDKHIIISITKDQKSIFINVQDNGTGIKDEIKNRIFEPYFTTKEEGKGIGMGLYISKMIIEKNLKGELYINKSVDNGTSLTIELPLN